MVGGLPAQQRAEIYHGPVRACWRPVTPVRGEGILQWDLGGGSAGLVNGTLKKWGGGAQDFGGET